MAVTPHGGSTGPAGREPRPEDARIPWDGLPRYRRVRDLKIHQVVPVAPGADYATLVAAVHDHHHDLLPVVEGGLLVGLVPASDLLGRLAVQALPGRGDALCDPPGPGTAPTRRRGHGR